MIAILVKGGPFHPAFPAFPARPACSGAQRCERRPNRLDSRVNSKSVEDVETRLRPETAQCSICAGLMLLVNSRAGRQIDRLQDGGGRQLVGVIWGKCRQTCDSLWLSHASRPLSSRGSGRCEISRFLNWIIPFSLILTKVCEVEEGMVKQGRSTERKICVCVDACSPCRETANIERGGDVGYLKIRVRALHNSPLTFQHHTTHNRHVTASSTTWSVIMT